MSWPTHKKKTQKNSVGSQEEASWVKFSAVASVPIRGLYDASVTVIAKARRLRGGSKPEHRRYFYILNAVRALHTSLDTPMRQERLIKCC